VERVGFVLKVKQERLEEYRRRHEAVWPEMQAALRETGWHNYSLFLREDGLLFGYLETPDFEKAREEMAAKEVNARWQADMAPFFEALDNRRPDEGLLRLDEIFHLD
jgi:L-rhamnose mutarotase